MFYTINDGEVQLRIKAQPGASRSEFAELYGEDAIKVRIKAPAVEGAANKELIKFIARSFKVPRSDIVFKTGEVSRTKRLCFPLTEKFEAWVKQYT